MSFTSLSFSSLGLNLTSSEDEVGHNTIMHMNGGCFLFSCCIFLSCDPSLSFSFLRSPLFPEFPSCPRTIVTRLLPPVETQKWGRKKKKNLLFLRRDIEGRVQLDRTEEEK